MNEKITAEKAFEIYMPYTQTVPRALWESYREVFIKGWNMSLENASK
jgi:hypothetical protein